MNDTDETDPTGLAENPRNPQSRKARLGRLIGYAAILLAICTAILVWRWCVVHPRCDDAVVTADIIGVASRVSGPITELRVKDNQRVKQGDVLFVIDETSYKLAVDAARANLAVAEGELKNAQLTISSQEEMAKASEANLVQAEAILATASDNYNRIAPLLAKHYASSQEVDTALHSLQSAQAGVAAAKSQTLASQSAVQDIAAAQARRDLAAANLAQAELALRYCTVTAPFDGLVTGLSVAHGAYVVVGTEVFKLIDAHSWSVEAAYREEQLQRIKEGDHAEIELKTAPGRKFEGTVESIVWGVTPQPTDPLPGLPIVPRNLDWVKLAQRFPVKIRLSEGIPREFLRVGATASATIEPMPGTAE